MMLIGIIGLLAMPNFAKAEQTFNFTPTSCGDHRAVVCTTQIVEGGTFHVELGHTRHSIVFTSVGPNKLTATDSHVAGSVISGDGIDRLHMDFSAKDASGNTITGACYLIFQDSNVNGVKYRTLTQGTITIK